MTFRPVCTRTMVNRLIAEGSPNQETQYFAVNRGALRAINLRGWNQGGFAPSIWATALEGGINLDHDSGIGRV